LRFFPNWVIVLTAHFFFVVIKILMLTGARKVWNKKRINHDTLSRVRNKVRMRTLIYKTDYTLPGQKLERELNPYP